MGDHKRMEHWEEGFTLVEVMIALAVFTIGMLGVVSLQFTSMEGNTIAGRKTRAGMVASTRIDVLKQVDFEADELREPSGLVVNDPIRQGDYWYRVVVQDNIPLESWFKDNTGEPVPNTLSGSAPHTPYPISKTVHVIVYGDAEGTREVFRQRFVKVRNL